MNFIDRFKPQVEKALAFYPYFVFLLPLFFVLHGLNENFGFVNLSDGIELWAVYSVIMLVLFGLFLLLLKKPVKAALITFYLFSVFFFYGVLQDFLSAHARQLNRYILLIPFFLLVFILLLFFLTRSKSGFTKTTKYLNLLLIILIVMDAVGFFGKWIFPAEKSFGLTPVRPGNNAVNCDTCSKPDVYLLLFDEYASSSALKKNLDFDNSDIDSFLAAKNFRLQPSSSSNYNFTPFSMSSILNMSYIYGINPDRITGNEYALCTRLLRKNAVTKKFTSLGYEIVNYSIFNIDGLPPQIHENFLPTKTELITGQTLLDRLRKHLLWHLVTGRFAIPSLTEKTIFLYYKNNNKLIDWLTTASRTKSARPRFIYAHFMMPHYPYLFDSSGNFRDLDNYKAFDHITPGYLNSVRYTNRKLKQLVTTIQENTNGKAAIIAMGDHGYRSDSTIPKQDFFKNFNAVYLPPHYKSGYYDSITGVNQFRVLFNSLFKTDYPLLKDSTVFLVDD